jgi:hypothetical protein
MKLYRTVILPDSYRCAVWSLTWMEKHGLRVREQSADENIWA